MQKLGKFLRADLKKRQKNLKTDTSFPMIWDYINDFSLEKHLLQKMHPIVLYNNANNWEDP